MWRVAVRMYSTQGTGTHLCRGPAGQLGGGTARVRAPQRPRRLVRDGRPARRAGRLVAGEQLHPGVAHQEVARAGLLPAAAHLALGDVRHSSGDPAAPGGQQRVWWSGRLQARRSRRAGRDVPVCAALWALSGRRAGRSPQCRVDQPLAD
eukprot:4413295-Prymnesium_polylepis.1